MTGTATAPVALSADTTVNSLNINGLGGTWNMTNKLTVASGMILRNGNNSAIDISSGTLTAGGDFHAIRRRIAIRVRIVRIRAQQIFLQVGFTVMVGV